MKLAAFLTMVVLSGISGTAIGQEAIPKEYGYKFAGQTDEAAFFLSGIRRGAEPESVEAWVWTVGHAPSVAAGVPDAKAELSILRCSGRSIEILKAEFYREGEFLRGEAIPPTVPKDIRPGAPMEFAWRVACDMDRRYSSQTLASLEAVYQAAR